MPLILLIPAFPESDEGRLVCWTGERPEVEVLPGGVGFEGHVGGWQGTASAWIHDFVAGFRRINSVLRDSHIGHKRADPAYGELPDHGARIIQQGDEIWHALSRVDGHYAAYLKKNFSTPKRLMVVARSVMLNQTQGTNSQATNSSTQRQREKRQQIT